MKKTKLITNIVLATILTTSGVNAQTIPGGPLPTIAFPWTINGNNNASTSSILGTTTSIPLRFVTGSASSERMRITETGDVGIGVTIPSAKLDVNGNAKIRGITIGANTNLVTTDAQGLLHKITFPGALEPEQVLKSDGTFGPVQGIFTYNNGAGLNLSYVGNVGTFTLKAHTGDAFSSIPGSPEYLTVVALRNKPIALIAPTADQVLSFDGTSWIPKTLPAPNVYTAGVGLNLSGTTFSLKVHTGDVSSPPGAPENLTVIALQNKPVSTTTPTNGQVLSFNGTSWTPQTPTPPIAYTAGAGLNLNGTSFSLKPLTGDITSNSTNPEMATVIRLQNVPMLSTTPTNGQFLGYNGSSWLPTTINGINGLSKSGNDIQLGGGLIQNTDINFGANSLSFTGFGSGTVKFDGTNAGANGLVNISATKFQVPALVVSSSNASTLITASFVNTGGHPFGAGIYASGVHGGKFVGTNYGIDATVQNGNGSGDGIAVNAAVSGSYYYSVGVNGSVNSISADPNSYSIGGNFSAGVTAGRYTYGVMGNGNGGKIANYGGYFRAGSNVDPATENYGIYAVAYGPNTNYAGYFDGTVKINGKAYCSSGMWEPSDRRLKNNIETVGGALEKVLKMRGVYYYFNKEENNGLTLPAEKQTGFIAQELEGVLPEAVSKSKDGSYSLNYIRVIPILVNSIKEQQTIIETQATEIATIKKELKALQLTSSSATGVSNSLSNGISSTIQLLQNNPNPFSESTSISYIIPETSVNAFIMVYNMQGSQIKKIEVNQKGKGSVTINGSELSAGMYLYSLLVDGKEIDTKRMILTK